MFMSEMPSTNDEAEFPTLFISSNAGVVIDVSSNREMQGTITDACKDATQCEMLVLEL